MSGKKKLSKNQLKSSRYYCEVLRKQNQQFFSGARRSGKFMDLEKALKPKAKKEISFTAQKLTVPQKRG